MCGHVFHSPCLAEYCRVHMLSVAEIRCPTCKRSSAEFTETIEVCDHDEDHDEDHPVQSQPAVPEAAAGPEGDHDEDHPVQSQPAVPEAAAGPEGDHDEDHPVQSQPAVPEAAAGPEFELAASEDSTMPETQTASTGLGAWDHPATRTACAQFRAAVQQEMEAAVPTQAAVPTMSQAAVPEAAVPTMSEAQESLLHLLGPAQPAAAPAPEPQSAGVQGQSQAMPQSAASNGQGQSQATAATTEPQLRRRTPAVPKAAAPKAKAAAAPKAAAPKAAAPKAAAPAPPIATGLGVQDVGVFPELMLCCNTCGGRCQVSSMRLRGKKAGAWECNNCGVKGTQLRRVFGKWPVSEFTDFAEDEKKGFFSEIAGMSMEELKQYCARKFQKVEQHQAYYEDGGQFLPLSVWERKGFPVADIEAKSLPSDRRTHPVLGNTYRVAIMGSGQRGFQGTTSTQGLSKRSKGPAGNPAAAAGPAAEAEPAASVESESDSSSSDCSSSSASKKKSKKKKSKKSKGSNKKKKSKKEAKKKTAAAAAAKAEAAAKKHNDKEKLATDKLCNAVLTKCEGASLTLAATLADPGTAFLPAAVLHSCKSSLEQVDGLVKRAKLILKSEMPAAELGVSKLQAVLIISNPILSYLPPLIQELLQATEGHKTKKKNETEGPRDPIWPDKPQGLRNPRVYTTLSLHPAQGVQPSG